MGDENLRANEIDAGDLFSDGVFDLDSGVHLDKEPFFSVEVIKEFDRARVIVADFLGDAHGGIAEFFANSGIEADAGGNFDDFLVAALDRAIAFMQMKDMAVAIAEDLDFDVFGARNVFF